MPTHFGRRYMRPVERISATEKIAGGVILLVVVLLVAGMLLHVTSKQPPLFAVDPAAFADKADVTAANAADDQAQAGDTSVTSPAGPAAMPAIDGPWTVPATVDRFTADNLYLKIDGQADAYQQFSVRSLMFGVYTRPDNPAHAIDVYWYDMGKPENAQGMYQAEAPPDATSADIGGASYQVGGAVFFCKGSSYVQVMPSTLDEADAQAALTIARRIAARIESQDVAAGPEQLLPQAGRVPDSMRYLAQDAFSLQFLGDVHTADYTVNDRSVTLFIHRADSAAAAKKLLVEYVAFIERYGQVTWRDVDANRNIVAGDAAGATDVVFAKGAYFGGVNGADDAGTARQAAVEFYNTLPEPRTSE